MLFIGYIGKLINIGCKLNKRLYVLRVVFFLYGFSYIVNFLFLLIVEVLDDINF